MHFFLHPLHLLCQLLISCVFSSEHLFILGYLSTRYLTPWGIGLAFHRGSRVLSLCSSCTATESLKLLLLKVGRVHHHAPRCHSCGCSCSIISIEMSAAWSATNSLGWSDLKGHLTQIISLLFIAQAQIQANDLCIALWKGNLEFIYDPLQLRKLIGICFLNYSCLSTINSR
jgi:hypothetical protein